MPQAAQVLLLAGSAQAAIIQNDAPGPPPPPSQPLSFLGKPTSANEGPSADGHTQNEAPGGLTQTALEVVAALPSLF
jgi:hypothetical protein